MHKENNDISNTKSKIGIIIPTLNEEKSIGMVIDKLRTVMKGYDFEIVVVDGKSNDRTVEIARQHNAQVIIQRKKGYGNALFGGYLYCMEELDCNILLTIDADNTYDAEDCTKIIEKIVSNDSDYIVGKRRVTSQSMSTSHRLGNKVISFLIRNILHVDISDTQCGLFAFRSYLIENIDFFTTSGWALNTELLTRAVESGMNISEVEVNYNPRIGETKVNTLHAGAINLAIILRMMRDSEPLMLLGIVGVVIMSIGIIAGAFVVFDYIDTGVVHRTNLAVLSAMLVITGVQIFSLGLVADMIKRRQQKRMHIPHNYYKKMNL